MNRFRVGLLLLTSACANSACQGPRPEPRIYAAVLDTLIVWMEADTVVVIDSLTWGAGVLPSDLHLRRAMPRMAGPGAGGVDLVSYWAEFAQRFPGAWGWLQVAPIEYEGGEQASVYWHHSCGLLCGAGGTVYVSNERGRWRVDSIVMTEIS